ncbi:MAG: UDP-N-acetylmuramate--L-alanine ligase, partial [Simkania negevensis]|nr:UDP-N-acetylmuramate--L-alanine ligase [Simkania negevensis]
MEKETLFLGIGGIGMSALAHILLDKKSKVFGIDEKRSEITDQLIKKGAIISIGERIELRDCMEVVYSSGVKGDHPVFKEAKERKLSLKHRSMLLQELMSGKHSLLIAGTHGKTTTSGLLTWVLKVAGLEPSFAVGGILSNLGKNGGEGTGRFFVAEADESDGSFLNYTSQGGIITNVEADHLDYWGSKEKVLEGFCQFAAKIKNPSLLFCCVDDPLLSSLKLSKIGYGFSPHAALQITAFEQEEEGSCFSLYFKERYYKDLILPLLGKHNVLNAAAVFGLALEIGVAEMAIREAFQTFAGMKRRLEFKGEEGGIAVYDDYGHHPTEISMTLAAMKKAAKNRRLLLVFQPHRYSRTKDLMEEFTFCFNHADILIMTDIYSAGEKPLPGIEAQTLLQKVKNVNQKWFAKKEELSPLLHTL